MEINIHEDKKIVDVWLSREEMQNAAIQSRLQPLYAKYKAQKYTVAVFQSGKQELRQSLSDLLIYNRRRAAELEVQREKRQRPAELGR